MQNDTTNTNVTVSAEEDEILARFAERATKTAEVPTDVGAFLALVFV
jgi:hypothetical protein